MVDDDEECGVSECVLLHKDGIQFLELDPDTYTSCIVTIYNDDKRTDLRACWKLNELAFDFDFETNEISFFLNDGMYSVADLKICSGN